LRVVHVVLSLDVGGLERNVINQIKEGTLLGQELWIVCLEQPGALALRAEDLGGRVMCLDKTPGIRLGLIPRLRSLFREVRPDIVHTHQIAPLFYAGAAARMSGGARVVHTEHGLPLVESRRKTRWLGRWSALHCDVFFCLTQEMADVLLRHRIVPRRKLRVIRNGIDTSAYRAASRGAALRESLGLGPDTPIIGSVGRLAEIKQLDVLIRAFARVRRGCPDAHLLLVGDGLERGNLEALSEELGLGRAVHFAGYQSGVADYLHAMNCFALTSRSEGTPQAVLEASVAGLPVVATRVGGIPEIIEDGRTGVLFEPGDEESLADTLLNFIRDPESARSLGEAARRRVESLYGIGRMAREYHEHFLRILRRRI
jgi:sugar transferase (PEP-CTERM/EpsH1 system associated)